MNVVLLLWASLGDQTIKNLPANAGDPGSVSGPGRSSAEGNGYPLWYSCLENPMDGGAWWATVHGLAESDTTETNTPTFSLVPLLSVRKEATDDILKACS